MEELSREIPPSNREPVIVIGCEEPESTKNAFVKKMRRKADAIIKFWRRWEKPVYDKLQPLRCPKRGLDDMEGVEESGAPSSTGGRQNLPLRSAKRTKFAAEMDGLAAKLEGTGV